MDHAIRAATEQAPATVEGLMSLVRAYGLASEHRHDRKTFDAVRDLASRLAAPPVPPQEPVAWAVYVQDASKKWRVEQLYTLAENAQGYAHKRKQLGETAFVSPLSASPPPPPALQEVDLLSREELDACFVGQKDEMTFSDAERVQRAVLAKAGLRVKEAK